MAAVGGIARALSELDDVTIVSTPNDGEVLTFDVSAGKFVPAAGTPGPPGADGADGATGPQGPSGGGVGVDVSTIGVVPGTDFSATLQADFDARFNANALPVHYHFPGDPTKYRYSVPVYLYDDYCGVSGDGIGNTVFEPLNGHCQPFVFGLRPVETPGGTPQAVTSANRPDAFGVLDSSIAPSSGAWKGFKTRANCYAIAIDGPATYGIIGSHGGRVFENWGECSQFTIQIALKFTNGTADLGTGSYSILGLGGSGAPGPWWFGADAAGSWILTFITSDFIVRSFRAVPNSTASGVHKLRVWIDFTAGTYGFAQNGTAITPSSLSNMTGLTSKRFLRNRGDYFCWIGPSTGVTQGVTNGAVPDYSIMAFSVRNTAVKTEPADDAARYDIPNGDTTGVFGLDGSYTTLGRTLKLKTSNALTSKPESYATVIPCGGTDGGIVGNFLRDLTIDGGGICLGMVLDFNLTRVKSYNGFVGFSNIPFQVIYPIVASHCTFGGFAFSTRFVGATPIRMDSCDFMGNGPVAAGLYLGCEVVHSGCQGQFFCATGQEAWMIVGSDQFGGSTVFKDMFADNEAGFVTRALILIEKSDPSPLSYAEVGNIGAASLGPGVYGVEFAEKERGATGTSKGQAYVYGLIMSDLTSEGLVKATSSWGGRLSLFGNPDQRVTLATPGNFVVNT